MYSKETLKKLYFMDLIFGLVLCIFSLFRFYADLLSFFIGMLVFIFSILGYICVDKYYDAFYGKKDKSLSKKKRKKRTNNSKIT